MKIKQYLIGAAAIAPLVLAFAAQATPVPTLSLSLAEGANTSVIATAVAPLVLLESGFGDFTVSVTTGVGSPPMGNANMPAIDLNSIDVASANGGTLVLGLTETNLTSGLAPLELLSAIGGTLANASVHFQTYFDPNNQAFGTTTSLTDLSFDTAAFAGSGYASVVNSGAPFSLTEYVTLTLGAGGDASFDARLGVPEPASLAILGIGLLGLGACGRKRTS